jgi:CRP-like cAMP-binding protein
VREGEDKCSCSRYEAAVGYGGDIETWRGAAAISCDLCRHRIGVGFEGLSRADTGFMRGFKTGHEMVPAGAWIGAPPGEGPFLFTLYSGWALRYRAQSGGLHPAGIILPGELVGVETLTGAAPDLRVRALTDVTCCRFDPARWRELLSVPSLADRIARIETNARIETEDRLLAAGRSATASVCHFFLSLYDGLAARRLVRDESFGLPLPMSTVAECLNLTPVHLRRVLRRLAVEEVLTVTGHRVRVLDPARLALLAGSRSVRSLRPLI